jgi:uncharacterized protein YfaA (DUF2138 family)
MPIKYLPKKVVIGLLLLAVTLGGAYALRTLGWLSFDRKVNALGLDLSNPDALLTTASLASLPSDLIKQPIAKKLLTEDLAFYYEAHEDRLGALGAIRRIAYEHDLSWSDAVIRRVLDEPAQVALWRDGKGALRHYAIAIKRTALTVMLEEVAKVALKDSQLTRAGEISTKLNSRVPLYALTVSPRRTFLIASQGEHLVILSDVGMLLKGDRSIDTRAAASVSTLLDGAVDAYADKFMNTASGANPKHRLAINAQTFAFGYQRYFSALEALRFDLDGKGNLVSAVLLDPAKTSVAAFSSAALLQSLPSQPALCAILPVDWKRVSDLADKAGDAGKAVANAIASRAQGPAGACWYAEAPLHSPVFAAKLEMGGAFANLATKSLAQWALKSSDSNGLVGSDNVLAFSPDLKLAEKVLAVNSKRFASIADSTGGQLSQTMSLVVVTPRSMASLVKSETTKALSADAEPHLRSAAQRLLWPRLDELSTLPAFRVGIELSALQGARGWKPLVWQPLDSK